MDNGTPNEPDEVAAPDAPAPPDAKPTEMSPVNEPEPATRESHPAIRESQPVIAALADAPPTAEKKWYIVHTYSGHENKAKLTLLERVRNQNLTEYFGDVLVPTESVT